MSGLLWNGDSTDVVVVVGCSNASRLAEIKRHIWEWFSVAIDCTDNGDRSIQICSDRRLFLADTKSTSVYLDFPFAITILDSDWPYCNWLFVGYINRKLSISVVSIWELRSCFSPSLVLFVPNGWSQFGKQFVGLIATCLPFMSSIETMR